MSSLHEKVVFLDQTTGKMQWALQLAGFRAITSYRVKTSAANLSVTLGDTEYAFESGLSSVEPSTLIESYRGWSVAATLRDLAEAFSIYLGDVYEERSRAGLEIGNVTIAQFRMRGIGDQLTLLGKNTKIDVAWSQLLDGFNRVRNCLAHRGGLVADKDLNEPQGLWLRWLAAEKKSKGTPTADVFGSLIQLTPGPQSAAAEHHVVQKERCYSKGSMIEVTLEELLQICGTFEMMSTALSALRPSSVVPKPTPSK